MPTTPAHGVSFGQAARVCAQIGLNSFGGPAGQIAVMHREVVERQRWVSERRFLHALNYCMALPGPEAQQLAAYLGWLMHGVRGAAAAGTLFVLPGFVVMLALAASYATFGQVPWVTGLLFGLQAAVVAIVAEAVIRIGRRTLHSRASRLLALGSFLAIFCFAVPFPVIILVAAGLGLLAGPRRPGWFPAARHAVDPGQAESPTLLPDDEQVGQAAARGAFRAAAACLALWLLPVIALVVVLDAQQVFSQQAVLFSKSAVLTFGGAYAVLGYITQQAVGTYGWVSPAQMITGLGLAETTPGPLILVLEFVGFLAAYQQPGSLPPLLAGTLGAVLTVWVTFLPCFLFIFVGAPYVERLRTSRWLGNALTAISAAVAGVVLNLAVWFTVHTLFRDVPAVTGVLSLPIPQWGSLRVGSAAISLLALLLVFRFKQPTLRVLAICAGLGVLAAATGAAT
jgi:chromate transporter